MNKWLTIIVFLLLTGCATNQEIVNNLEQMATPTNCFWHGIDVPSDAVHTGTIIKKTEPKHIMGSFAAVERECGEIYGTLIGGCTKNVNGGDFPDMRHEYEIVFTDECGAVHEACNALYEVGNERHSVPSTIRLMQGDWQWACPPTV